MQTVVNTPAQVWTCANICLCTNASNVIQPDLSMRCCKVPVVNLMSSVTVPDMNNCNLKAARARPVIFLTSGVTRVGGRHSGRQLTVSPIFPQKLTIFLVITFCKVMTFLAVVSSQLPPSDVVCPSCSFQIQQQQCFYFIRVSPLDGVTRGGPHPRPPP